MQNLVELTDINPDVLNRFQQTWTFSATTANKRIEELRAFFRFCVDCGWITVNPARALKRQRADTAPREPFTEEEIKRILSACEQYPRRGGVEIVRLKAFVQLLLDTGLRIGDAVRLERRNVVDDRLRLRTAKTGTPVALPLSQRLIAQLNMVVGTSPLFYFWSGNGKLKSAVGDWQRSLSRLFKLANVPQRMCASLPSYFCEATLNVESSCRRSSCSSRAQLSDYNDEALRAMDSGAPRKARSGYSASSAEIRVIFA